MDDSVKPRCGTRRALVTCCRAVRFPMPYRPSRTPGSAWNRSADVKPDRFADWPVPNCARSLSSCTAGYNGIFIRDAILQEINPNRLQAARRERPSS